MILLGPAGTLAGGSGASPPGAATQLTALPEA